MPHMRRWQALCRMRDRRMYRRPDRVAGVSASRMLPRSAPVFCAASQVARSMMAGWADSGDKINWSGGNVPDNCFPPAAFRVARTEHSPRPGIRQPSHGVRAGAAWPLFPGGRLAATPWTARLGAPARTRDIRGMILLGEPACADAVALRCMTAERFDAQAPRFDDRAGIPEDAARAVAQAVLDLIAPGRDDLLVELGAGTGQIGRHLARSMNYLGLDRSGGMLDAFRAKVAAAPAGGARLVRADANRGWPVEDGSAKAVFASRVIHLLDSDHVRSELERVCAPGGYFLVGHVSRDEVSVKHLLREKRESLLRERGLIPRSRRAATRRLLDRLVVLGASYIESRSVVTWSAQASAKQVVDAWGHLQSMSGTELESRARAGILAELMEWAGRELGDPNTVRVWRERYILGGVRLKEGTSTAHC